MPESIQKYLFTVDEEDELVRVDQYLARKIAGTSRSQIKNGLEDGQILVNNSQVKPKTMIQVGDRIQVHLISRPIQLVPQEIPLDIVYEDESLIVLNKPAGLVMHPGAGTSSKATLVEGVLHCCKLSSTGEDEYRPGIVHRLDRDTSGLVVIAKNNEVHRDLAEQFKEKIAKRNYLALVDGSFAVEQKEVEGWIGRHPKERAKFLLFDELRKPIKSKWSHSTFEQQVVFFNKRFALLRVSLKTGRTHQIRVHLAHLKTPVLGDPTYGLKLYDANLRDHPQIVKQLKNLGRQMLHAHTLTFCHPKSKKLMTYEGALPEDFKNVLASLEPNASDVDKVKEIIGGKNKLWESND